MIRIWSLQEYRTWFGMWENSKIICSWYLVLELAFCFFHLIMYLGLRPVSPLGDGCCSVGKSCPTLCDPTNGSTPDFPVLHYLPSLLKLRSIESVIPSNHLILCHPLLLLPPSFPNIMFIYPVSFIVCLILCHGWLWLWSMASLQFNHSPTDGHLGCCRVFALLGGSFLNSPKDST